MWIKDNNNIYNYGCKLIYISNNKEELMREFVYKEQRNLLKKVSSIKKISPKFT